MATAFYDNPLMDIPKMISERLKAWMSETPSLNTLQKLEQKSGVGFGTVRRARNGDGNITVEKLTAIAQAFGRHPAELLTEDSAPTAQYEIGNRRDVHHVEEPAANLYRGRVLTKELEQMMDIAEKLDAVGRGMLLERARQIAEERLGDDMENTAKRA